MYRERKENFLNLLFYLNSYMVSEHNKDLQLSFFFFITSLSSPFNPMTTSIKVPFTCFAFCKLSSNAWFVILDYFSSYSFHVLDSSWIVLISSSFNEHGYRGWRKSILVTFSTKNKFEHMNGRFPVPAFNFPDLQLYMKHTQWELSDYLIIFWRR